MVYYDHSHPWFIFLDAIVMNLAELIVFVFALVAANVSCSSMPIDDAKRKNKLERKERKERPQKPCINPDASLTADDIAKLEKSALGIAPILVAQTITTRIFVSPHEMSGQETQIWCNAHRLRLILYNQEVFTRIRRGYIDDFKPNRDVFYMVGYSSKEDKRFVMSFGHRGQIPIVAYSKRMDGIALCFQLIGHNFTDKELADNDHTYFEAPGRAGRPLTEREQFYTDYYSGVIGSILWALDKKQIQLKYFNPKDGKYYDLLY